MSRLTQKLGERWTALPGRERALLRFAAIFIGLLLTAWYGVATPLASLRRADLQRPVLQQQWQDMAVLQAEARALQALPRPTPEATARALQASLLQRLGASAQWSLSGGRATVTLRNAPTEALAAWLAEARLQFQALPVEARLQRHPGLAGAAPAWDGSLGFELSTP
jgi:general secretion pathway protein M